MEFDPFSAAFQADPFPVYRWLRDEAPVYYSEKWGWWALSRFDDVRAAALDPDTFRSFEGIDIDDTAKDQSGPGFLPDVDNPRHDQVRAVVQPFFLPRRIAEREDAVRRTVRGLLAGWRGGDVVDLATTLAWPMPNEVFFDLLGLPTADEAPDDRRRLERWVHELKDRRPDDPRLTPTARAATAGIQDYFVRLLQDRRAHPRDDLVTGLVQADIDGVPFADEHLTPASEILGLMMVLFLGGVESTAGLTGSVFKLLAEHPDQRRLLQRDPALAEAAVEETVRIASPLTLAGRTTSREVTLHGVTIPAGGRVVLVYAAANRDERQFPDPDRFDLTRPRQRHLGFSEGLHGCLGAPLARLEVKVALQEALPLLGDYELAAEPVRYRTTPNMYVWSSLPVTPRVAAPPQDLSVFYDPLSYAAYDHPYDVYRELRDRAPVYYNARRDLWVVSRYADVKACLRDHEHLVNALGNDMDGTHDSYGTGNLVAQDQPRHSVLRTVVRPSFSAAHILALEDHLRARARGLLADLVTREGGFDAATDFAVPLVFAASLQLMGIEAADSAYWEEHLMRSMVRTVGELGVPEDASASNHEGEARLAAMMDARAAEIEAGAKADTPDVISQILLADAQGRLLEGERIGLGHLVFSASTDAPAALLTNCLAVLDRLPALQSHLRAHPELVPAFVEETLRWDGPAKNLCRQTTTPVTIAGVTIPANQRVMVLMGSANRDERVHADPDRFDLHREITADNKILTFGEGIHSCMGAPLARLTTRIAIEELVAALHDTELRIVGRPERWSKQMVRGFSRLPVKLVPVDSPAPSMRLASTRLAGVEQVQTRSTQLTLARREFEAVVRVEAKTAATEGVVALRLREATGQPLPPWEPGSHVDLVLDGVATRQYSLCGDVADPSSYRLGILRDAAGSGGSLHVHDVLAEGDLVRIRGPRNNFPLLPSARYLFVAGGIGITPMLPMIAAAEAAGADWRLVYGGRTRASMGFLDELAAYGDRVTVWPQDERGFLPLADLLGTPQPDTLVYCCGPGPLLDAVEAGCAHWPAGSLHVERFVAKPLTAPVLTEAFDVHLERSGLTLTVPTDRSILSVLDEAGVPVLSSCGEGTCGTCETAVLAGVPDHRDSVLDAQQREQGDCLMICVSRSCTPLLTLDV